MTDADAQLQFKEWRQKAHDDEQMLQYALGEGGPWNLACFHAQQAAEKLLKGLLVVIGQEPPKQHDLLKLSELIRTAAPGVDKLHDDLTLLRRYYIETRYPGDYPEFTEQEARQAAEAAARVKNFVISQVEP